MRIHTNTIERSHLNAARRVASAGGHGEVWFQEDSPTLHGSRSHHHAFNVKLEGDGSKQRRRVNAGRRVYGEDVPYAATYDAWGWFLGHLFIIDPTMHAGPYKGADDFHRQTHGKYTVDALLPMRRAVSDAAA